MRHVKLCQFDVANDFEYILKEREIYFSSIPWTWAIQINASVVKAFHQPSQVSISSRIGIHFACEFATEKLPAPFSSFSSFLYGMT